MQAVRDSSARWHLQYTYVPMWQATYQATQQAMVCSREACHAAGRQAV
jgi:hypothetical protein